MKEVDYLSEWFERLLRNRDIFLKKIKRIEHRNGFLIVEEKTRTVTYKIAGFNPDFDKIAEGINEDQHYGIILYNTIDSFKAFVAAWSELSKIKHLVVYFINPFSRTEKKWVVYPATHNRISEKSVLKSGLKTMFDSVETIDKKELLKIIS